MKIERPQFELTRIYSDGTQEEPEIVPVAQMPWDTRMNRRGALGVGLTVTGILSLLSGCDGKNIFTAKIAKETELQDSPEIQKKSPATVLKAHKQNIFKLMFSADSTTLVSSSSDFTVKQWAIPDGKLLGTISETSLRAGFVAVTPEGKTLVADLLNGLGIWSLPGGSLLKKVTYSETGTGGGFGGGFALSPDGKICAFVRGKEIQLYSVPEGELLKTLTGDSTKNINFSGFAPNGKFLISGAMGEEFKLWSIPDGNLVGKLEKSYNSVGSEAVELFFNPECNIVALNNHGQLRFWSLPDGSQIQKTINDVSIQNPTLTSDGKMMITIGTHYPTPGPPSPSPSLQTPSPNSAPSPNYYPTPVSTPYVLPTIKLWSFPDMELQTVGKVKSQTAINGNSGKMIATRDGKMLAIAFQNINDMWLMSLPELKLENVLKGPPGPYQSVFAISPDSRYLAVGDSSGTIMIWDLQQREFLSYLFDKTVNKSSVKGVAYNVKDKVTGRIITYTLPCGSPIPPGAVCTCNCVPGAMSDPVIPRPKPRIRSGGGGFSYCSCNKICTCIPVPSDRDLKEAFETTDAAEILQKLSEISIKKWNYKWDDASIRHIGPMAQDFAAAFEVGDDDKHIHPVDANGVALAAIQGLYQMLKEKVAETQKLQAQLQKQSDENRQLKARIEKLERGENLG